MTAKKTTKPAPPVVDAFAVTNPPNVAAGELIESSWGNAVVTVIGDVASIPVGSGIGSVANHLFDLNQGITANTSAVAAAQTTANNAQTAANTANTKSDNNSAAINNMLHPPAQAAIGIAANTANTTEKTIAQFTIPTKGLYLVGYQLDFQATTGFGQVDAYLKVGTVQRVALFPLKFTEPAAGSRTVVNGLVLADFNAGDLVLLNAVTFAGSIGINGGSINAPLLRTP